jgi:hypothetical protein
MPSSAVIRVQQQQQQQSVVNQNNHLNSNSENHTISMFRLFLRAFDYIYLISTKLFSYFLLMFKRLLRFLFGVWTFIFVTLRGSKKKVLDKKKSSSYEVFIYSLFNFNQLNIIIVLFNHYLFIDYVCTCFVF